MHCYRSFMYREGIQSNLRLGANPMLVFLSTIKIPLRYVNCLLYPEVFLWYY